MKQLSAFLLIIFLFFTPLTSLSAQGIKPDIRNYDVFVAERRMPSQPCGGKTPAQWVAEYVGFNELADNDMQYPDYLYGMSDQVQRAATRLSPKIFKDRLSSATKEKGNPTTWVGEICWYQPELKPRIIGEKIIESQETTTQVMKKIRDANARLSSFISLYDIPLENGKYSTQKEALVPDPYKQSECPDSTSGIEQAARTDKGSGQNSFSPSFGLLLACSIAQFQCQCEDTKMFIRTDSTVPYSVPATCQGGGCTDEQIAQVDPKNRPDDKEKKPGWMVAQVQPGLMGLIIEMIQRIFGDLTGKVAQQQTKNNVNEPISESSYHTTEGHEMSMKFTNCKLLPFALRSEYKECNTNWLAGIIGNIKNKLQGTGTQTLFAEPAEATPSVSPTLIMEPNEATPTAQPNE